VHDTRNPEKPVTYTAAHGLLYAGASGPQIVMENGSYQEASARTGAVSILNFERAAIALNDLLQTEEERYRDPQERFVAELLAPDPGLAEEVRQRLAAEGHQRLASPLYTLAFAVVAVAVLLAGDSGPRGRWTRVAIAIGIAGLMQIVSLVLLSVATRTPAVVPAMYLAPLAIIAAGLVSLANPLAFRPRRLAGAHPAG